MKYALMILLLALSTGCLPFIGKYFGGNVSKFDPGEFKAPLERVASDPSIFMPSDAGVENVPGVRCQVIFYSSEKTDRFVLYEEICRGSRPVSDTTPTRNKIEINRSHLVFLRADTTQVTVFVRLKEIDAASGPTCVTWYSPAFLKGEPHDVVFSRFTERGCSKSEDLLTRTIERAENIK